MNRVILSAPFVALVLGMFALSATAGCVAQSTSSGDSEVEEASLNDGRRDTPYESSEEQAPVRDRKLQFEGTSHPTGTGNGPVPDPWLPRGGPVPDPWTETSGPNSSPDDPHKKP